MRTLTEWLAQLGLAQYAEAFAAADLELDVLPELTDADLQSLGVSLGHRKRMLRAIRDLERSPAFPAALAGNAVKAPDDAGITLERRQVSILFCDRVGSTALSEHFDPEDLHGIINSYRQRCDAIVERFDGSVAQFQGDGILVRFGYPKAHEDDAERAVGCALELASAIADFKVHLTMTLQVRIAVATGSIVVGDGLSRTQEPVGTGDTPNLAARLQTIAQSGQVVVDQLTRRLAGGAFLYRDLGFHSLKGFAAPVPAWQVVGVGRSDTRFAARNSGRMVEMIGREHELALLLHRWAEARDGEGQVVLLSGEAGIGKSRLVAALIEHLPAGIHTPVWQCSAHHVNTALFPALDQLARAAGISPADSPEQKIHKLEQLVPEDEVPILADILGIPNDGRYQELSQNPIDRRQRTLEAMLNRLRRGGRDGPVCFIVEDLHWIDPTSLELLELGIDLIQSLPVLTLVTSRPDFSPNWARWGHVTTISLTRLNRRDSVRLVENASADIGLPKELFDDVVERAEGVPLYLEELTRSLAGMRFPDNAAGGQKFPKALIPSSLQGSLIERLDRLSAVKELAQIASVIGREVSAELLGAVAAYDPATLEDVLERLAAADIMHRRRRGQTSSFVFKHALIQDAAYNSLLRARRRYLHGRVAAVLEAQFPDRYREEPEVIAHHLTEAGEGMRACEHWLLAARHAIERSANREAVSHTSRALEVLDTLPPSVERDRQEIAIQTTRLAPANNFFGFSSDQVEQICRRLRELYEKCEDLHGLCAALYGEFTVRLTRADVSGAFEVADTMADLTQGLPDRSQYNLALRNRVLAQFFAGNLKGMGADLAYLDRAQGNSDLVSKTDFTDTTATAVLKIYDALYLWSSGFADRSEEAVREALAAAQSSQRANITMFCHLFGAVLAVLQEEMPGLERHASTIVEIGDRATSPNFASAGRAFHAMWLISQGEHERGCSLLQSALEGLEKIRTRFMRPLFLCGLALGQFKTEGAGASLQRLAEAEQHGQQTGEVIFNAFVHLKASVLLLAMQDREGAKTALRRALNIARAQGLVPIEAKAALSLAELLSDEGRGDEAAGVLETTLAGLKHLQVAETLRAAATALADRAATGRPVVGSAPMPIQRRAPASTPPPP